MLIPAFRALFRLMLAGVLFACSEQKPFSDAFLYQFLCHVDSVDAVMRDGSAHKLRVFHYRQPWTEDDRLYYSAPQMTGLKFKGVPVASNARFSVGFGFKPNEPSPATGTLRFRVEMLVGSSSTTLVDETVEVASLAPGEIVDAEAMLPAMDVEKADFLFYSEASLKADDYKAVWCQPELRFQADRIRDGRQHVSFRRIQGLLLDLPVKIESIEGNQYRCILDEANRTNRRDENGGALVQEVPARTVYRTDLPRGSGLSFSTAQFTKQLHLKQSVIFEALVNDELLFKETLGTQSLNRSIRKYVPIPPHLSGSARIELRSSFGERGATENVEQAKVQASWVFPLIETTQQTRRLGSDEGKNLLIVVVDALRADHLSCYGYDRPTTPALDALAEKSVVFENAFAQSSWTVPSTATLFTGQYAYTHGVYDQTHWFLIPGVATLSDVFSRQGFTTACFSSNLLICTENNLIAGFESYNTIPYANAAQLNRAFLEWLDTRKNERFFTYLHYMDPHGPYTAPGDCINRFTKEEWDYHSAEALRNEMVETVNRVRAEKGDLDELPDEKKLRMRALHDLYDGEIAYWDACFENLLDALDQRGILDDTVVVVTSDHGEEFFEHGLMEHGQSLYNELLHVPLIIYNASHAPKRREETVGLIDMAPTLLTLFDIPYPSTWRECIENPRFSGYDLFKQGSIDRDFLFADTSHGTRQMGGELFIIRSIISDELKGILSTDTNTLELFDPSTDRAERHPIDLTSNPLIEAEMRRHISEWVETCTSAAPYSISLLDAAAMEKLREIGYLK